MQDRVDSSRQPKGPVSQQQPSSIGPSSTHVGKTHSDYGQLSRNFALQQPPSGPSTTQGASSKEPQRSLFRPPQVGSHMDPHPVTYP